MAQMLVIADDLTGAADCGVACAGHGLRTMVVLGDSGGEVTRRFCRLTGHAPAAAGRGRSGDGAAAAESISGD